MTTPQRPPVRSGAAPRGGLTTVALIAGLVAVLCAATVDTRQPRPRPSLATIAGLGTAQVSTLQRSGIRSIAALAAAQPATLTRALGLELAAATRLVEQAKTASGRLRLVYADARVKFPLSVAVGGRTGPAREDPFAQLIAPTNECTLLVRKVCGLDNQCAGAPGCALAKQLLDAYNTAADNVPAAEACLISLEDGIVFPSCVAP